ncbi:MAG: class GN sortase [Alphaproteobacteria bacterium]
MAKAGLDATRLCAAGLLTIGVMFTAGALWIPAKAALAQHLLERAWQRTLQGRMMAVPWPWADTWPVARLTLRGRAVIVLANSGGEGLAFGPTHVAGSAAPGGIGAVVVSAHRDTHFRDLDRLRPGEVIGLEARDGKLRRYRVTGSRILAKPELAIPTSEAANTLVLVTCWPLDGIDPGTAKRFVLFAQEIAPGASSL